MNLRSRPMQNQQPVRRHSGYSSNIRKLGSESPLPIISKNAEEEEEEEGEDEEARDEKENFDSRYKYCNTSSKSGYRDGGSDRRIGQASDFVTKNRSNFNTKINDKMSYDTPIWKVIGVVIIPLLVVLFGTVVLNGNDEDKKDSNKVKLRDNIMLLKQEFPTQNSKIWTYFVSSIPTVVVDPFLPAVFLFLYDYGEDTSSCLAYKIGKEVMKFVGQDEYEPLTINGVDLKKNITSDYGEILEHLKLDISKRHTLIVHNLQEVPATIAQMFHFLCDGETPLIKQVVYLFTLKVKIHERSKNPTEIAERNLNVLWEKDIKKDILSSLIARITSSVFLITPEENIPCSL